jgi:hypothetical protein
VSALSNGFCVFADETAAGLLAFLPLIEIKEGGRRFFQVSTWLALAAIGLGHSVRAAGGGYGLDALAGPLGASLAGALLSAAFAGVYLKVLGGPSFTRARPFLIISAVLATVAVVADGLALAPAGLARVLVPLDLVSGASLLGSVALAMTLGHFYLVIPRLSIEPLGRLAACYLGSVVARAVVFGAGLALVWDAVLPSGRPLVYEQATLLAPRALFGVAGPLLLAFLTRGTVTVGREAERAGNMEALAHPTQSATGILYGATVLVVVGELLSVQLAMATGFPL